MLPPFMCDIFGILFSIHSERRKTLFCLDARIDVLPGVIFLSVLVDADAKNKPIEMGILDRLLNVFSGKGKILNHSKPVPKVRGGLKVDS